MSAPSSPELDYRPSYRAALGVSLGALVLYLITLSPFTAMWDTSEYIAAAYTFGLPTLQESAVRHPRPHVLDPADRYDGGRADQHSGGDL
jgi:hypothetical protein